MPTSSLQDCLLLQLLPKLTPACQRALLLHYGSVPAILAADPRQWRESVAIAANAAALQRALRPASAQRLQAAAGAESAAAAGAGAVALTDSDYPPLLATLPDPPPVLYVRGDAACLQHPQLAIVGSRKASAQGLRAARDFAAAAAAVGLTVCSGLARGIDGAAHGAALDAGGSTVAVMATGIDCIYPKAHAGLAARAVGSGCLVTELLPGAAPERWHFPRRNRIISGLSLATLVVEAALPSGSLLTARSALEQGREVCAVPQSVYHPGGRGCLQLLAEGATLARSIDDVLAQIGPVFQAQCEAQQPVAQVAAGREPAGSLPPDQAALLALFGGAAMGLDELVAASGQPVPQLLGTLSLLELAGRLQRSGGGYQPC